ncbi:MAG TPA: hypothetical protein VHM19_02335, partial [Polyangiales bacterium]|nr:hypothetical protein [Polyangiales bacterium]
MRSSAISVSTETRHALAGSWELASVAARAAATPAEIERASVTWAPAQVPCTVASTRRAAGRDVFREPVALDAGDHWFRCRFAAPVRADGARVTLRFEGLATLAQVWLNGELLLESTNMFVPARCDVTERLQPQNELCIRFASLDADLAKKRPRPRWRTRLTDHQQLRWQRTSLLGRMPGWSPPVHAVGPWRPIELVVHDSVELLEARVRATLDGLQTRAGKLSAELVLDKLSAGAVARAELNVAGISAPLALSERDGKLVLSGEATLRDLEPWWPHTHGKPALYPAQVRVQLGAREHVIDLGRVGFRSIEVDREKGFFALRINGEPIFCRGASWMTPDSVSLPSGDADYLPSLIAARDAGMNMLRISGTTCYESDAFFRACDELGILVWQDFMFANMDYPIDDAAFAASVEAEARGLLTQLPAHPSLAMLCGGSEVEQQIAMMGLPREQWAGKLFHELLPALQRELAPSVPYVTSTPTGGALPFEPRSGVTHYYGVGAYLRPLEDARRAEVRFAAECLAFSNVPDESTFSEFLRDGERPVHHPAWKTRVARDVGASWDFEDVREHYLRTEFGVDPLELRYTDLERYLALSRVVTGEVMARTLEEWRRARSTC